MSNNVSLGLDELQLELQLNVKCVYEYSIHEVLEYVGITESSTRGMLGIPSV